MLTFGQRSGFLSTVAVIAALSVGAANAQNLRNARGPAEFPPATYDANQYVDSRGCVFVRAGIGGSTDWVPRVSRDRAQLCGFEPTQVAGATRSAPRPDVPNPLDTPVAGLAPRGAEPEPVEAPAVAAAPAPAVRVPTPAAVVPTAALAAPSPIQAAAPAPQVATAATPSPRVVTAPAAEPQPRVLTKAQACEGLTGIQSHLIGQRSGRPIDCGGAPAQQVAALTTPEVQTPAAQSAIAPQRLGRVAACADMVATGRQYVSARTGLPIQCDGLTQPAHGGGLFANLGGTPPRPSANPFDFAPGAIITPTAGQQTAATNPTAYSNPLDAPPGSITFTPGANTSLASSCNFGGVTGTAGLPVRCGPQAQSPSGSSGGATVTRARTPLVVRRLNNLVPRRVPESNPATGSIVAAPAVPEGYTNVWSDGRLNTQRGLPGGRTSLRSIRTGPQTQSPSGLSGGAVRYAATPVAPQVEVSVSTRTAPQAAPAVGEQLTGNRYVQVGTFTTGDQAQSVAQALRARGLPMRVGVYNSNGQEMRMVLAGPFNTDNQLQNALGTARGAGFSDAFARR